MSRNKFFVIFIGIFGALNGWAGERDFTTLIIKSPEKTVSYSRSDLLARKDLTYIDVENDPAYPGTQNRYMAVPAAPLFDAVAVPKGATLLFTCQDGFSAPISGERLLNRSSSNSIAYIAIEKEDQPWGPIKNEAGNKSPGPFYLIWLNPKASKISREEWPFQLVSFEVKASLEQVYPDLVPTGGSKAATRGMQVFTKNCFTCHTLNHTGEAHIGPDLNLPMSPMEYLTLPAFKKLVRNPKDLRTWPDSKMSGFSQDIISDNELEDLVVYLQFMSHRKKK